MTAPTEQETFYERAGAVLREWREADPATRPAVASEWLADRLSDEDKALIIDRWLEDVTPFLESKGYA